MPNLQINSSSANSDALLRHNVIVECLFSGFNGVFLGLIWFGSHVTAKNGLNAGPLELAILVSAFPMGAFLGPLWANLGRRWGMKNLVRITLLLGGAALLPVFWVDNSAIFTAFVALAQIMNSAMRMGQASLYRIVYPEASRGRVLGMLTFFSYATMVPSMLLTGWLLDVSRTSFQYTYPAAGFCALCAFFLYGWLRVPLEDARSNGAIGGARRELLHIHRVFRRDRLFVLYETAFFLTGAAFFLSRPVIVELTKSRFPAFTALEQMFVLSVVPPILLAVGSPLWGFILDRIGLIRCRLLISVMLSAALVCYFCGLSWQIAAMLYMGSILQGISNGGGQLTWFLGSTYLARRIDDVPRYNQIHFVLNGVRGMAMPWVGALFLALTGTGAVLAAVAVSLGSIPVLLRALMMKDDRLRGRSQARIIEATAKVNHLMEPESVMEKKADELLGTVGGKT